MTRLYPYLLVALAVVGYVHTPTFDYALDDHMVITDNRFTQQGLRGLGAIFTHDAMAGFYADETRPVVGGRYRPLTLATHAIEYELFGKNPAVSHVVNVVLYAATVLVLFRLLQSLFPESAEAEWVRNVPFLAAALFAAHPVHTEVVANIKGRDDVLSLLLGLVALRAWLRWVDGRATAAAVLAAAAYLASLLSKESTLAPAIAWWLRRKTAAESLATSVPLVAAAAVYVVLRLALLGVGTATIAPQLMNHPFLDAVGAEKPATLLLTWLIYLKLLFVPYPLTHDYYPYHVRLVTFAHPLVIASIVVHAALAWALVRGVARRTIVSFCILWYAAALALYSNVVFDVGTFLNERFLYVASIGFCIAVAWLLATRVRSAAVVTAIAVVLVAAGAVRTYARSLAWRDDVTLALTDVATSRGSARAQSSAGWAYLSLADDTHDEARRRELLAQAIDHLTTSIRITDTYYPAIRLLGSALAQTGRYADALHWFETALAMRPANADVLNDVQYVAEHAASAGDRASAVRAYELMIAQRPTPEAYAALGQLYAKDLGDVAKAEDVLGRGIARFPRDAALMDRLGIVTAMSGRTSDALERFDRAIALDPTRPSAYRNKAMALRQLGRTAEADAAVEQATRLDGARRR